MQDISLAIQNAKRQREFSEYLVDLQGTIRAGVYPNILSLLKKLERFQFEISSEGRFSDYVNDPIVVALTPFFSSDAVEKLSLAVQSIEKIERDTMSADTGQGIFELNLPI